jgi:hypothetical protein
LFPDGETASSLSRGALRDSVDEVVDGWRDELSELDDSPMAIITSMHRLRAFIDVSVSQTFGEFGL